MTTLKTGISGVRGIYGESLTRDVVIRFARSFGKYLNGGKVVIGMDSRQSGPAIKDMLVEGLKETGCDITCLGLTATPTCQLMVEETGADGGIEISASHNPEQWNGLKFIKGNGIFLNGPEVDRLLNIYNLNEPAKNIAGKKFSLKEDKTSDVKHIKRLLSRTDTGLIKSKNFHVVIDSCNGAGSRITPLFLKELGCRIVELNCLPRGHFSHSPEPIPANLKQLSGKVKETGAAIGFAQDPDADRLAIVAGDGTIIGEEYTLCLAVKSILSKKRGPVVTNLSTTRAVDDIAREYGCPVIRTKIGEVHVAERMLLEKAVIGGEGNGGVIDPRIHYGRDSLAGIAIVLELMATTGKTLSELFNGLPQYYLSKEKIECPVEKLGLIINHFKNKHTNEKLDFTDGLRIDTAGYWTLIRGSNTEPVVRAFTESPDKYKSESINKAVLEEIKRIIT